MYRFGPFRAVATLLVCSIVAGCVPSSRPLDEQKEPHFLAGKSRCSTMDYKGAIECFERALQVNPKSASAHFELACLFDEKEVDPSAAIYHYEHYLRLNPKAENADLARARILLCKQALAQTVTLGPVTDRLQREFDRMSEEKKKLTDENRRLLEELSRWTNYAARLQAMTNNTVARSPIASVPTVQQTSAPQPAVSAPRNGSPVYASANLDAVGSSSFRTHTVKAGETPSLIAKKYGIRLESLNAANPGLNPRRMKVGQVLRIPNA